MRWHTPISRPERKQSVAPSGARRHMSPRNSREKTKETSLQIGFAIPRTATLVKRKRTKKKNSVIDRTIKTRRLLLLPQSGPIKNSLPRRKVERQKSASVYDLIIKTRTTRFSPFRWLIGVASWWGRIFPATPFPPKKKPQVEEEEEDGARLSLKIGSIRSSFFFFFFPFYIYTQSYIYI